MDCLAFQYLWRVGKSKLPNWCNTWTNFFIESNGYCDETIKMKYLKATICGLQQKGPIFERTFENFQKFQKVEF